MAGLIGILIGLLFFIMNFIGAIVSLIWLVFEGDWEVIGYGLAAIFGGAIIISLMLMPIWIFAPLLSKMEKLNISFQAILMILPTSFTFFMMSCWCIGVFQLLLDLEYSSLFPLAVWSYVCSVSPISFLASKEQNNEFSQTTATFIGLATFVNFVLSILGFHQISFMMIPYMIAGIICVGLNSMIFYHDAKQKYPYF